MTKSFSVLPKLGESFQDDLDETLEAFETNAELDDVSTDHMKKKAIPIMVKGASFRLYPRNNHTIDGYEKGI